MELAQITAGQVVMLFLLMGTGIAAVKTGVLKPEGKQTLSNLLVYLVVPAMIVNSYRMEFSMEILRNLHEVTGRGRYVFPCARGSDRPMSDNAILAAMRRSGIPAEEMTGHGFRAMARTINTDALIGAPGCPHCGNRFGLAMCGCGQIFCVSGTGEATCPG